MKLDLKLTGTWRVVAVLSAALALAGCSHLNASYNDALPVPAATAASGSTPNVAPNVALNATPPTRARLHVDGQRGHPKALVFLSLSGGGSRSAYLSAQVMSRLRQIDPEFDLMAEVDAISSVSGGSLAGAYYASTRDEQLLAPALVAALQSAQLLQPPLQASAGGALRCNSADGVPPLPEALWREALGAHATARLTQLCRQAGMTALRTWEDGDAQRRMRRNYMLRWVANGLWPVNIAKYWFTAYDRSDLMAQTLEDNLFDTSVLGRPLRLGELNPQRPFLVINATTASEQPLPDGQGVYPFGSVFTFTDEDFRVRLGSDIGSYSLARAVMASSAFPLVFANMSLRDHRSAEPQYLHVFDGGNSDNLGLRSVKRMLLELAISGGLNGIDRIVVLQVDAYGQPRGVSPRRADPRGVMGRFVDDNALDAVDALLQNNRQALLTEFDRAILHTDGRDCEEEARHLPPTVCNSARRAIGGTALDLSQRLVFYHLGFQDAAQQMQREGTAPGEVARFKRALDAIPTSFSLAQEDAELIDRAADLVVRAGNPCLGGIKALLTSDLDVPSAVRAARRACQGEEGAHGRDRKQAQVDVSPL